jgi:hypothetical protein
MYIAQCIFSDATGADVPPIKKRSRPSDVMTYLREKKDVETELRREELALQRERLSLDERRFELEREERLALINLLKNKM